MKESHFGKKLDYLVEFREGETCMCTNPILQSTIEEESEFVVE